MAFRGRRANNVNEQTSGQLRQLLQALGTMLTTLGFATAGQVDLWIQIAMQVAGPLAMVGGVIWSWWVNRPKALVASVVAMADDPNSPVKGVVMAPTIEGRALANEFDTNKIAAAGTFDAKQIATPG
jgi:hypothetical protein